VTGDHAGTTSGRIIFLDDTSGSGRKSIARELLDILDDGFLFHLAVDGFNAMRTGRGLWAEQLDTALRRTGQGRHRSITTLARVDDDIVVDLC
jgi:chloramphenicol 3-O phosphotransferase